MNKLTFLLIASTFIIITTLYVNSLELSTTENPVDSMPSDVDNSVNSLFSALGTFFRLLTFRVDGVPELFNIIFLVIAVGILYIIVDVVKDVIPFT